MNFFEELKKLKLSQPHLCVHVWKSENSDYCDQIDGCKNCYLCFNNRLSEDCMYCYDSRWNNDCADLSYCNKCELCYDCLDCEKCYGCIGSQDCENCDGCIGCYDCKGCSDCFGCVGLRKRKFCIYNEEFSEGDYKAGVREASGEVVGEASAGGAVGGAAGAVSPGGWASGGWAGGGWAGAVGGAGKLASSGEGHLRCLPAAATVAKLRSDYPHISLCSVNTENCFGNYIVGSKNSYYVFKVHNLEDCFYMYDCQEDKDCTDCCAFNKSELCYGCIENSTLYNCDFMYWCANCVDSSYVMYSFDCENCFGCFGLRHKKFCILNEQCVSKEEYFARLAEIVGQMKKEGSYMSGLAEVL